MREPEWREGLGGFVVGDMSERVVDGVVSSGVEWRVE